VTGQGVDAVVSRLLEAIRARREAERQDARAEEGSWRP
jgi:hypothetical protein